MDGILYNALESIRTAFTSDDTTKTTVQALLDLWNADTGTDGAMQSTLDTFKTAIDDTLFADGGVLANDSAVKSIHTGNLACNGTLTFPAEVTPDKCIMLSKVSAYTPASYTRISYTLDLAATGVTCTNNYTGSKNYTIAVTVIEFY